MEILRSFRRYAVSTVYVLLTITVITAPVFAAHPGKNGRIAFVASLTGTNQLYTINPDGSDLFQVTNLPPANDGLAWFPDFSPDGRQIVFGHDMTGALELYIINADGSGLTQITHGGGLVPRWSPDGTHLVFSKFVAISPLFPDVGAGVIATIKADGTDEKLLSSRVWDSLDGEYTPDGKHIVFETSTDGYTAALWIMNTDGSHQRRLTDPELQAGYPDVSPDGKQIIFYNNQNSPKLNSIFKVNIDGTGATRLTGPGPLDTLAAYSPDGSKILFMSDRRSPSTSFDIFIMNADGSNQTPLIEGGLIPNWGPKPQDH